MQKLLTGIHQFQDDKSDAASCLIPLCQTGTAAPLFCIHPSGGDVGIFRKLVRRMSPKRFVFGIQSRLLTGEDKEFPTIDAMAEHYECLIQKKQPQGPIQLLGFSLGGFIAAEVASRLRRHQRAVAFLGLIDSDLRWLNSGYLGGQELEMRIRQLLIRFQQMGIVDRVTIGKMNSDVADIVDRCMMSDDIQPDDLIREFQSRRYVVRDATDGDMLSRLIRRFLIHTKVMNTYSSRPIDVPLKLWWPSQPVQSDLRSRSRAWQSLTTDRIVERVIPGNHYSIMRMPAVQELVDQLNAELLR